MSNANDVPMMFRATVNGRCQLQYIDRDRDTESRIEKWVSEWTSEVAPKAPNLSQQKAENNSAYFKTEKYQIAWRFVSNSGADPTIILPVIGARGYPYYPGSSMKGAFRQACNQLFPDRVAYYCGEQKDQSPGILRFHGGYPTSKAWTENLIDLAHPQQEWQVKTLDTSVKEGGAFVQISLHKPELRFGISSAIALTESKWQEIWQVWQAALSNGIGCRVCAGYGKPTVQPTTPLYKVLLQGQGIASTLLDKTPEFRANIFRAALRGHALRIFGGLTDKNTAELLVEQLFGGIHSRTVWGLLNMGFRETRSFAWEPYGYYEMPYYTVQGELTWLLTRSIGAEKEAALKKLITHLMQFAMLLDGFGKSWRRADHREFYYEDYEKLIGCHWRYLEASSKTKTDVRRLDQVKLVIDDVRQVASEWMQVQGVITNGEQIADWRETWHPSRVQVWGRDAEDDSDSQAIEWFHEPYIKPERRGDPRFRIREQSIKNSSITGQIKQINQIGRIWHRMYPVGTKPKPPFLELLTIFPDGSSTWQQFEAFLKTKPEGFKHLW